jgi:ABC-type microcin C transport system permease subunit YejE
VLRAWLLGLMLTFGFAVGGLALLMVQYCTGGKWGLLLRRPLEAMSRTLPLIFAYWAVVALSLKRLYLWAAVDDVSAALQSDGSTRRSRRTQSHSSGRC